MEKVARVYIASPYTKWFKKGGDALVYSNTIEIVRYIKDNIPLISKNIIFYSPVLANMHINNDKGYDIIMEDCYKQISDSDIVCFMCPDKFIDDFIDSEGVKSEYRFSSLNKEINQIFISKNLENKL